MIAASLACRLPNDTYLHFRQTEANPEWYSYKIVSWKSCDVQHKVYTRVYKGTSIHWGKVTHLCKQGIDEAKQGGASREDISQQKNHEKESIDILCFPQM
jgi:hypothetical protein